MIEHVIRVKQKLKAVVRQARMALLTTAHITSNLEYMSHLYDA